MPERFETSFKGDPTSSQTSAFGWNTMADAYRPKESTASSIKTIYGKTPRLPASKNQTSVLPKIDRHVDLAPKPLTPSLLLSPSTAKMNGLSIQFPSWRPSTENVIDSEEMSPTFCRVELEGPVTKSAWHTPRNRVPEPPPKSHVAAFFAASDGKYDHVDGLASTLTPARLQSVEDSINAAEKRYYVDIQQLTADSEAFLEISASANQHLEHMHHQLPNISDVFDQTASSLQNLSSDIDKLHEQNEVATKDILNRFEAAMSNNVEEMADLLKAHGIERAESLKLHEFELQKVDQVFREKVAELEERHNEMERKYLRELQELKETSDCQEQALQEQHRVAKEEWERSAKTTLQAVQVKARDELDDLRSSSQLAYTNLQERSQAEFAELQQTSTAELAAVKTLLTSEISSLKQNAAADLAALTTRSERELQEHREQSSVALQQLEQFYTKECEHLREKAARLQMSEIEQSARTETRRCQETTALRDELKALKLEHSTHIDQVHHHYKAELERLKTTSEAERALLLKMHATDTEKLCSAASERLAETMSLYEARLHSMTETHAVEMIREKEEAIRLKEDLIAKYEADLTSLGNERAREKDAMALHYETELEAFKQASSDERAETATVHEAQVAQLRDAHSARVLFLEMAMREQAKQTEDTIHENDIELTRWQRRVDMLEAGEIALKKHHDDHTERSQELVEQKCMALSELETEIWFFGKLNEDKDVMLNDTTRALKAAEEALEVKANTILELTFVIKSRDEEMEKLRNALLDTVQTVNTKTEMLELTTETLSSKAKELEVANNALRLETDKLLIVEESMNQKVGVLEDTGLKMESMRLNMENMRLEVKRMEMDMKLELEHMEGEMELKNGEIHRLYESQSEVKQKNDDRQQTIERLEESLAFAQRQGEEAQRRIELLRLEAAQAADDMKKTCDEVVDREQKLVILTREKQMIAEELQRLQAQNNDFVCQAQALQEKVELRTMQMEEVQSECYRMLEAAKSENDERIRSKKYLHMLELSASKEIVRHLREVKERLSDTTLKLNVVTSEKQQLKMDIKTLDETLKKVQATNEDIGLRNKLAEVKAQELVDLNKQLRKTRDDARYEVETCRMEIEDLRANVNELTRGKDELMHQNVSLQSDLFSLHIEKEQLMVVHEQEKSEIGSRDEKLHEKAADFRIDGARATRKTSDLQHALNEKRKELECREESVEELMEKRDNLAAQLRGYQHIETVHSSTNPLQEPMIAWTAEEQIREVCAHSLELMIIRVAYEHEVAIVKQQLESYSTLTAKHSQSAATLSQMAERSCALEVSKADDLLQKYRVEEEHHTYALSGVRRELSGKLSTLENVEDLVSSLASEISEAPAQFDKVEDKMPEGGAGVSAQSASIDNARKDLNLLLEPSERKQPSADVITLLRYQLERHLMEAYHIELSKVKGFVLEDEGDLLQCVEEYFAMRCYRGMVSKDSDRNVEPGKAVSDIEEICERLQEYDRVVDELDQVTAFAQRCKNALLLPGTVTSTDEIIKAIEQLMKILQHFELLQPKLGSPLRQSTTIDSTPTLENKVNAVLAFVEELQLMADFAQNILNDESRVQDKLSSNGSSRSSLGALDTLEQTPSSESTFDELQIDVDLAVNDALQGLFDQNFCEFSNEAIDKHQDGSFSSSQEHFSSRSPSPFLADSLMDISLVMSDHHRLLSQTTHWVKKPRAGGTHANVGTEISCLVREHCALLSLSRRLLKLQDPGQDLFSLLEGVALLERMAERLTLVQKASFQDAGEVYRLVPTLCHDELNSSESAASLTESDINSTESLPLASIRDIARHLRDYCYLLQQIKGLRESDENSAADVNIEVLVQRISERMRLVEQSKARLGLQNPVDELLSFLVGAQEVLRQAKLLRSSSFCYDPSIVKTEDEVRETDARDSVEGLEAALTEMDAVVEDLQNYNGMLAWLKQVLPQSESVKCVAELKDRVKAILEQIETLTRDNANLLQDNVKLKTDLEQMEQRREGETLNASVLMHEKVTALEVQTLVSPVEETSTQIELLQALIGQQRGDLEQRRADMTSEAALWQQDDNGGKNVVASTNTCPELYKQLLQCVKILQLEKSEMETSLNDIKRKHGKLITAAAHGTFTLDQEKLIALELEATREREARENLACKFRLNEEYYRRLLDEHKEMEIAQTASIERLCEECKTLRLKLDKLEEQSQRQTALPQFRPPSNGTFSPSSRASLASPQTPRLLKSATVPNVLIPIRPERPRQGGSAQKNAL